MRSSAALALLASLTLSLAGCRGERAPREVTARPDAAGAGRVASVEARAGRLGARARVAYADIEALAAAALPERHPERGSRRVCRRVVGVPLCGTARWDVTLARTGAPVLAAEGERVAIALPLRFDGEVGIDGRVARALGLGALDVRGAAVATARLGLDVGADWCPRPAVDVAWRWSEPPELAWKAGIELDLRAVLDEAIATQLATLDERLGALIDCAQARERLETLWREHHVRLTLPETGDAWLHVRPLSFGFSGVRAEPDALGVGFVLSATTVVDGTAPAESGSLPLPPLERVAYDGAARTAFDLLIRADYARLDAAAIPALVGRSFEGSGASGAAHVDVTSIAFSGGIDGVTVAVGFAADLPATQHATNGVLYLSARPVVDPDAERVTLADIRLSRVLDNRLWALVGTIFENQIVDVIERRAVLELGERTAALEALIVEQLEDPERTGGLVLDVDEVDVHLLELVPERDALVAVARVRAEIEVRVPSSVLERPLDR